MPLDGAVRRSLVERAQSYMEGRTGDGSALQGSTDQRLYLVPQIENALGDWIDDPARAAVPFAFDGQGTAWDETDSGGVPIEELAVFTRQVLPGAGAYAWGGYSWTIASGGSTAAASASYAFAYVLHRHVE